MKAEDTAIQVGANGGTDAWWQAVLTQAAECIDFLSVHSYPCWKWTGYELGSASGLDGSQFDPCHKFGTRSAAGPGFGSASARIISPAMTIISRSVTTTYLDFCHFLKGQAA
jgi:hypothetical protein